MHPHPHELFPFSLLSQQPTTLRAELHQTSGIPIFQYNLRGFYQLQPPLTSYNLPLILMQVISPNLRPGTQGLTHCFSGCCQSFHLFMGDPDLPRRLQAEKKPSCSCVGVSRLPIRLRAPRTRTEVPSPGPTTGPAQNSAVWL